MSDTDTQPATDSNPALALRTIAELTQTQAAHLIGVTPRTWRNWENGVNPMPSKKARAFTEAVRNLDSGDTALPTDPGLDIVRHPQIQAGIDNLRQLGRVNPYPASCYTPSDPFGQKRLKHLLAPAKVETTVHNGSKPAPTEGDFVDANLDGVTGEELAEMVTQVRASKARPVPS